MTKLYLLAVAVALTLGFSGIAVAEEAGSGQTNADQLCQFVQKKLSIAIRYYYDPISAPERILQPYGVGVSTAGNTLLFGLQLSGYSKSALAGSSSLPGWRNFKVPKIAALRLTSDLFTPGAVDANEYRAMDHFVCKNFGLNQSALTAGVFG